MKWQRIKIYCFTICSSLLICLATKGFSQEIFSKEHNSIETGAIRSKTHSLKSLLEFKAGYSFFSHHIMSEIYNKGGINIQFNGSVPLFQWLHIDACIEYWIREGKSLNDRQKTTIWGIPLSIGFKPIIPICSRLYYYVTVGPRYYFVQQKNNSIYVEKKINAHGLGGFANTGFCFSPMRHFLIDIFGEYSYKELLLESNNTKLNVFYSKKLRIDYYTLGVGLGYEF